MKKITDSYLTERLRRAAKALLPDKAAEIWQKPVEKASGGEWYLDGTGPRKRRRGKTLGAAASIAACFAVCFLSFFMINLRVDATVYLDVNPGITLQVNCNEKVMSAEANNRDGEIVLEDMELKHTDLDVAVNAIVGSMVRHGYLGEAKDIVLLSVSGRNTAKTEALRTRLSGEINTCLTSLVGSGAVFDQDVDTDGELEALAREYGITPGKAALIQRVVAANPSLDYGELAGLPMNDLTRYLAGEGVDLRQFANLTGALPTDAPISESAGAAPADDGGAEEDDADDADAEDREEADTDAEDGEDYDDDSDDNSDDGGGTPSAGSAAAAAPAAAPVSESYDSGGDDDFDDGTDDDFEEDTDSGDDWDDDGDDWDDDGDDWDDDGDDWDDDGDDDEDDD